MFQSGGQTLRLVRRLFRCAPSVSKKSPRSSPRVAPTARQLLVFMHHNCSSESRLTDTFITVGNTAPETLYRARHSANKAVENHHTYAICSTLVPGKNRCRLWIRWRDQKNPCWNRSLARRTRRSRVDLEDKRRRGTIGKAGSGLVALAMRLFSSNLTRSRQRPTSHGPGE